MLELLAMFPASWLPPHGHKIAATALTITPSYDNTSKRKEFSIQKTIRKENLFNNSQLIFPCN